MSETVQWIDVDGGITDLNVEWGMQGRFMPPVIFEEQEVPGQPGAVLVGARHGVRDFRVPIWIEAVGEAAVRSLTRSLIKSMNPVRGPGRIRVTGPGGDQREIRCSYSSGLEIEELPDQTFREWQKAPVVFRAHNPYWEDVSSVSNDWSTGVTPTFFPFFPLRLTSSEIAVDATITNNGDVESWPVWTITGPGSGIVLRNLTTGEFIKFPALTMGVGQKLTIDTRPGEKTVTLDTNSDPTNMFGAMDPGSSLWALQPGDTALRLEMSGITVGTSKLSVSYKQRYLTA